MGPPEPVYEPSGAAPSLCHTCSFVRVVAGRFDQVYLLCQNDLLREKYPRQPMRQCDGYGPMSRSARIDPIASDTMESSSVKDHDDPALADVEDRIKLLLGTRLQVSPETLARCTPETSLLGQGIGLDSIEALTLAVAIEEEFGIEVDDADLTAELFASVGTLATYVHSMTVTAGP